MMRFYSLSLEEVMELEPSAFEELDQAIAALEARELLALMRAMDYPHYKKGTRETIHKELHKSAFPFVHERDPKKPMTTGELAALLNRGG